MRKIILLLLVIACKLSAQYEVASPYNQLKELLPFNGHGWYPNAEPMEALLKEKKAKVVIELGSWLGLSTRHIAQVLPEDGIVYAVDHWLGNPASQKANSKEFLEKLYDQFLSNVIHTGLTEKIYPVKMTTEEAAQIFKEKGIIPDVVYVDAAHDEESVFRDLTLYYPLVRGHGTLCGDDWGYGNDLPVQKAVKRFAMIHRLQVEVHKDWFWVLREANMKKSRGKR